jgi:acetyltransferase-like isoleucine patch superfamily enzyme
MPQQERPNVGKFSIVREDVQIGKGSRVWNYCKLYGCTIGIHTSIGSYCEIKEEVRIGDRCQIKSYVAIPKGTIVGNDVFLGPRVTILNDKHPNAREATSGSWKLEEVVIEDGASIGGGSVILPGVRIGKNAIVAAGAVVTKNVPEGETWMGNPARPYKKSSK